MFSLISCSPCPFCKYFLINLHYSPNLGVSAELNLWRKQCNPLMENVGPGNSPAGLKSPFGCWLARESSWATHSVSLYFNFNESNNITYLTDSMRIKWYNSCSMVNMLLVTQAILLLFKGGQARFIQARELTAIPCHCGKEGWLSIQLYLRKKKKLSRMSKEIKINFLLRFFFPNWWLSAVIRDKPGC